MEKDLHAAERQIKSYEATFAEMTAALELAKLSAKEALEAKEAVQVALEDSERTKASEIKAAMAGLLYRFKRYNPGKKLYLDFNADPPPLPEGMTEDMIEDYEGEVAPEENASPDAE
ncbi:unnamed protein product, partial [Prunus brigantina]